MPYVIQVQYHDDDDDCREWSDELSVSWDRPTDEYESLSEATQVVRRKRASNPDVSYRIVERRTGLA